MIRAHTRLRLICLPHAGGGAATFSSWAPLLPDDIDLWPVQPPGRQDRASEAPFTDVHDLVAALVPAAGPLLDPAFAVFGHSLGADVAFELVRALASATGRLPEVLFVSGRRAPQLPERNTRFSRVDDETLVAAMRNVYGYPREVLQDEHGLALALVALRADSEMADRYRYTDGPPLGCPIVAFGGDEDPLVGPGEILAWGAQTSARFALRMFPGEHMYIERQRPAVVRAIARELDPARAGQRSGTDEP